MPRREVFWCKRCRLMFLHGQNIHGTGGMKDTISLDRVGPLLTAIKCNEGRRLGGSVLAVLVLVVVHRACYASYSLYWT